ncbi:MAG: hypothetical protein GKR94_20105 [Gammaproteobacteria bacterium]|nr:hypothetical protein [Gammaproteobacteria bacterium]
MDETPRAAGYQPRQVDVQVERLTEALYAGHYRRPGIAPTVTGPARHVGGERAPRRQAPATATAGDARTALAAGWERTAPLVDRTRSVEKWNLPKQISSSGISPDTCCNENVNDINQHFRRLQESLWMGDIGVKAWQKSVFRMKQIDF